MFIKRSNYVYTLREVEPINTPLLKMSFIKDQNINIDTQKIAAEISEILKTSDFDLDAEIKRNPESLYVKCFAIKADEPNDNGDYFCKDELIKATPTFVGVPIFTNHQNTDINQARGKVVHSWWDESKNGIMIIARVDAEAYPKLARLIQKEYATGTSMGCWTGEMRVLTESGEYIPIKDIQAGDMVYTHLGNVEPVLNVQRHLDKENDFIYQIKVEGIPEILECTKEHPFWVLKSQIMCSCGCGENLNEKTSCQHMKKFQKRQKKGHYQKTNIPLQNIKNNFEFEWKASKDLKVNDFVSFPISKKEITDTDATISKARLIGYFLAEGSFNKYKGKHATVIFSLSKNEKTTLVKEISTLLKKCFPKNKIHIQDRYERGSMVVHCYGSNVAQWFLNYCGEYSHKKKLATKCLSWPKEIQKHIVGAWLAGDGHLRSIVSDSGLHYHNFVGTTTSEVLRSQMTLLLSRFGIKCTTNVTVDCKASTLLKAAGLENIEVVNGSSAQTRRPSYSISIGSALSKQISDFICPFINKKFSSDTTIKEPFRKTESHIVFPIRSITRRFSSEPVYNLEVQNDHSYIVEGVAVKNCQVKFSLCSICHNYAEVPSQYCEHVRERKTRTISAKNVKCRWVDHSSTDPCPLCGSVKTATKSFDVTDSKVFEHNYGIKFIENSFVVNPACHDCGVTDVIDPKEFLAKISDVQARLPQLLKAAQTRDAICTDTQCSCVVSSQESNTISEALDLLSKGADYITKMSGIDFLRNAGATLMKLAGQKEINDLNNAINLLASVGQSMLTQKDQLDLEFLSDLIKVLADLQAVTDELSEQGYGRLQSGGEANPANPAEAAAQSAAPAAPAPAQVDPKSVTQSVSTDGGVGTAMGPLAKRKIHLEKVASNIFNNNKNLNNINIKFKKMNKKT